MPSYHAKKRFGQNFLKSEKIIHKIIDTINPQKTETIIEIGPGRGALTLLLAKSGAKIIGVEFDRDVLGYLKKLLSEYDNVQIINEDFLEYQPDLEKFKLIGNIPYNITSPIIDWMINNQSNIETSYLMMQKEMALRLSSKPDSKNWAPLSIMAQLYFDINLEFDIGPKNFQPAPKVMSSLVSFNTKEAIEIPNKEAFEKLVKQSFAQRRKLLINNLVPEITDDTDLLKKILTELEIDLKIRAEQISTELFLKLTQKMIDYSILSSRKTKE